MAHNHSRRSASGREAQVAYLNERFLESADARTLRIAAEYLEPQSRLRRAGVENSVVFFGSARILSREAAEQRLRDLDRNLTETGLRDGAGMTAARMALQMSQYYEEARELARKI